MYVSIRPVFFFQIIWSCLEEIVCLISTEQPEIRFMRKANIICIQKKNGVRCLRFTFTLYILWKVNLTSSKYIKIYTNNNRVIDKKKIVYISPLTLKIQKKNYLKIKENTLVNRVSHWLIWSHKWNLRVILIFLVLVV